MENHWESTNTSLSHTLFLSNTPTRLIWYLIQASRMCEGPNKNRRTKHCHCKFSTHRLTCSSMQTDLDRSSPLLLLGRAGRMIVHCSPATTREKQGSSIERSDANTQLQDTERVEQGQVVASSLTCCKVLQEHTKLTNHKTSFCPSTVSLLAWRWKDHQLFIVLLQTPPSLPSGAFYTPTHSLPSFFRFYNDSSHKYYLSWN